MKKTIKKWLPYVVVVVVGMIAWIEVSPWYAKARAAIAGKVA